MTDCGVSCCKEDQDAPLWCAWLCPAQLAPLLVLYLRWSAILFLSVLHSQTLKHWQRLRYHSIYREGLFSKHCVKFLGRVAPISSYQVRSSVLVMTLCHMTRSHCPQWGGVPNTETAHSLRLTLGIPLAQMAVGKVKTMSSVIIRKDNGSPGFF